MTKLTRERWLAEEDEAWRAFASAFDLRELPDVARVALRNGHKAGFLGGCEWSMRRVEMTVGEVSEQ